MLLLLTQNTTQTAKCMGYPGGGTHGGSSHPQSQVGSQTADTFFSELRTLAPLPALKAGCHLAADIAPPPGLERTDLAEYSLPQIDCGDR